MSAAAVVVLEGEIDIDMDALDASPPAPATASVVDVPIPAVGAVSSWSAHDGTLVGLFQAAADSYDVAHPASEAATNEPATKRARLSTEAELKAVFANYPPVAPAAAAASVHAAAAATPVATPTKPKVAVMVRSSSHAPNQFEQTAHAQSLTRQVRERSGIGGRPVSAAVPNNGNTPHGNKQIAALLKQQQAARRGGGAGAAAVPSSPAAATPAAPAAPAPASSSAPLLPTPVAAPAPVAAATDASTAAPSSFVAPMPQWSPPPFPGHLPPGMGSMPGMPPMPSFGGAGGMMPPMPGVGMPPMPPMSHESMMEDASLTNLLLSWYYAGYYTGKHQTMKVVKEEQLRTAQQAAVATAASPPATNGVGEKRKL